jgi:2-polyprenyl-3-methyl-5-hydroxy-6-metoxy-1,4-benzoquinol methylase
MWYEAPKQKPCSPDILMDHTDKQNEIATIAKALGHPARVAIIEYLIKVDACICGDIVNELPLAQPTVSQHLKELKNAGLIKGSIEGNAICYCVNKSTVEKLQNYFSFISTKLTIKKTIIANQNILKMDHSEKIKEMVKQKYSKIALQNNQTNATSCCGSGNCSTEVYNIMNDEYRHLEGYNPDADLKLGCGLPTEFAKIKKDDTVVDLGSGAGNDCFVARHETGETGEVIGIDFTEAMIEKARTNAEKLKFNNVEFRLGDIENIPITANVADVVVSNCVMNLVPNKLQAFSEVYRILKTGGHFSISDIVLTGELLKK